VDSEGSATRINGSTIFVIGTFAYLVIAICGLSPRRTRRVWVSSLHDYLQSFLLDGPVCVRAVGNIVGCKLACSGEVGHFKDEAANIILFSTLEVIPEAA